jgi:hypothetical protein
MIGIVYIPHDYLWDYCFKLRPTEKYCSPDFKLYVYKTSLGAVCLFYSLSQNLAYCRCLFHQNQLLLSSPALVLPREEPRISPLISTSRRRLLCVGSGCCQAPYRYPPLHVSTSWRTVVAFTVPALFIQQRVLQDLQTITQFNRSAPKSERKRRTLLKWQFMTSRPNSKVLTPHKPVNVYRRFAVIFPMV